MSVYYDKARNKWGANFNFNGKRLWVGRYPTKKHAEAALALYEKGLRKNESYTLSNYKLAMQKPRKNKDTWLHRIRTWRSSRKQDKAVAEAIEKM